MTVARPGSDRYGTLQLNVARLGSLFSVGPVTGRIPRAAVAKLWCCHGAAERDWAAWPVAPKFKFTPAGFACPDPEFLR